MHRAVQDHHSPEASGLLADTVRNAPYTREKPMTPPTMEWVVDTGNSMYVAKSSLASRTGVDEVGWGLQAGMQRKDRPVHVQAIQVHVPTIVATSCEQQQMYRPA